MEVDSNSNQSYRVPQHIDDCASPQLSGKSQSIKIESSGNVLSLSRCNSYQVSSNTRQLFKKEFLEEAEEPHSVSSPGNLLRKSTINRSQVIQVILIFLPWTQIVKLQQLNKRFYKTIIPQILSNLDQPTGLAIGVQPYNQCSNKIACVLPNKGLCTWSPKNPGDQWTDGWLQQTLYIKSKTDANKIFEFTEF